MNESSSQLQNLAKKLGSCIHKARPYYEATEKAKALQMDCQRAAIQYQRANGKTLFLSNEINNWYEFIFLAVHQAAKETIALAEERFSNFREIDNQSDRKFDSAWQEMLNHATMKVKLLFKFWLFS